MGDAGEGRFEGCGEALAARVGAAHRSPSPCVAKAAWSDEALLAAVRREVSPSLEAQGGIEAWIVADTGLPKKSRHSVGVARQDCGQLGKQDSVGEPAHATVWPDGMAPLPPKPWSGRGRPPHDLRRHAGRAARHVTLADDQRREPC